RLQLVSTANSFWRPFHLSPASRLKCWWSRKPRGPRRLGVGAFETRFSSSMSRWSLLPARTGTPCSDSAGHPHLGLVVSRPDRLQPRHRELLEVGVDRVFGVSILSCWEVAKLVQCGRLKLDRSVGLWIESAFAEPGVSLLHLHPLIVVESTQL